MDGGAVRNLTISKLRESLATMLDTLGLGEVPLDVAANLLDDLSEEVAATLEEYELAEFDLADDEEDV